MQKFGVDSGSHNLRLGLLAASGLATLLSYGCAANEPPAAPVAAPPVKQAQPSEAAVIDAPSEPAPALIADRGPSTPNDPSCVTTTACGGESCCEKTLVPGGRYLDKQAGMVEVKSFFFDKYELTVSRVQEWVRKGRPTPSEGATLGVDSRGNPVRWNSSWSVQNEKSLIGWARYDTWRVGSANLPKNFIDWYTGAAVCHFAGGRLPTDAEWRYAAVGGEEGRPYPWGNEPQTPERAVYNCSGDGNQSCSLADVLPVGSRPSGVSRWGQLDLAGSMFEWTMDAGGTDQVVSRGGGFCYIGGMDRRAKQVAATENVRHDTPSTTSHMVGARCAFDLPSNTELAAR